MHTMHMHNVIRGWDAVERRVATHISFVPKVSAVSGGAWGQGRVRERCAAPSPPFIWLQHDLLG